MAFSPDTRTLASLGTQDRTLKFWDVATGNEMLGIKLTTASDLAFHPEGTLLSLATGSGVRLFPALRLDEIDAELADKAESTRRLESSKPPEPPRPTTPATASDDHPIGAVRGDAAESVRSGGTPPLVGAEPVENE